MSSLKQISEQLYDWREESHKKWVADASFSERLITLQEKQNRNFEKFIKEIKREKLEDVESAREQRGVSGSPESSGGMLSNITGGGGIGGIAGTLTSIGLGLGGFFLGLGAADKALSFLNIDGSKLKDLMVNLGTGLNAFTGQSLLAFGALLGAGALFGSVSLKGVGKAAVGMTAVGLGLGGFFSGFALGGMVGEGLAALGADGEGAKKMMVNLATGLKAFSGGGLAGFGALLAAGGLFGAVAMKGGVAGLKAMGGAVLGMTAVGLGIGGFFAGLALGDAGISLLGADGSGIKKLMVNLGEGLQSFANLGSAEKILAIATTLPLLGTGMIAIFGGDTLGKLSSFFDWITGGEGESPMQSIVKELNYLKDIDTANMDVTGIEKLSGAIGDLGLGMSRLAGIDIDEMKENLQGLGKIVAYSIPLFNAMWNGNDGVIGATGGSDFPNFGRGLKNAPVNEVTGTFVKAGMINSTLGESVKKESVGASVQQGQVTVIQGGDTNVVNQTSQVNNTTRTAPASPTNNNGLDNTWGQDW